MGTARTSLQPAASDELSAAESVELLDDLAWRGLIQDVSDLDGLAQRLARGPITLYTGYDPTASSLHLGNLQMVVLERRFQLAGHRVIALSGGGTGMIGDPSGKEGERAMRTVDTVTECTREITGQLRRLLPEAPGMAPPIFEDNLNWIGSLTAVELLRDVGKHFPLSTMLAKESVASRLGGQGISFTEFTYMILQALDFQVLYDRYDCELQIGGSDQWGNITAGLELLRRTNRPGAYGFTAPLILRADGKKFGKSEEGALWLDPARTSPFALYQYLINTDDADVGRLLRRLSLRSRSEILRLEEAMAANPAGREAQEALAADVTSFVHGADGLDQARRITRWLFTGEPLPATTDLAVALAGAVLVDVRSSALPGWDRLLPEAGLATSISDARRLLAGGGVYINDRRVDDAAPPIARDDFLPDGVAVLRRGKRRRVLLRLLDD